MNPSTGQEDPEHAQGPTPPSGAAGVQLFRRILVLAAWTAAGCAAILLALLLAVQADGVSTLVGRMIARTVSRPELRIEVGRVTGSWIGGLILTDLRVSAGNSPDTFPGSATRSPSLSMAVPPSSDTAQAAIDGGRGGWSLSADSMVLRYHLLPLLRKTFSVEDLHGSRVVFRLARSSSSPEEASSSVASPAASTASSSWHVRIGAARFGDAELEFREAGAPDPGAWTLSDGHVVGHDLRIIPRVGGILDTLTGSFRPPGRPAGWGRIFVSLRMGVSEIQVDTLLLDSPDSRLTVRGTVPLRLEELVLPGLNLQFSARPLALRDVGPFLPPAVSDSIRLDADGFVRTEGDSVTVSVEASGAGRLTIRGAVTGSRRAPTVRSEVRARDLDLLAWGLSPRPLTFGGNLDADIHTIGEGTLGQALFQGTVRDRMTTRETSGRIAARSDTAGGTWSGEWSAETRGLTAEGTARLLPGPRPRWGLEGQVSYDRTEGGPPVPGADVQFLDGSLKAEGEGRSLDSLAGRVEVEIGSGRIGRAHVDSGRVAVEVVDGEAALSVGAALAGGQAEALARVNLGQRSGRLLNARLRGLDLAALLGDSVPSSVNVSASGSLESPSPLRAALSVSVDSSRYGNRRVDSANATMDARNGSFELHGRLALEDSSRLWIGGQVERSDQGLRMSFDSLTYAHLNMVSLAGDPHSSGLPTTDLSGRAQGWAARGPGGAWTGHLEVWVDSSRIGEQAVVAADLVATLDTAQAHLDLDLRTPSGGLTGRIGAAGLPPETSLSLTDAHFIALDPGAFLGRPQLKGSLSGTARGELRGLRWPSAQGQMHLVLDSSRVGGVGVQTGSVDLGLQAGTLNGSIQAQIPEGGEIRLQAHAELGDSVPTYRSSGSVRLPGAGGAGESSARGDFLYADYEMSGSGKTLDSLRGNLSVQVDSAMWRGAPISEGRMAAAVSDGSLRLDTLALASPAGTLSGGGRLPLRQGSGEEGQVRVHAEVSRAELLAQAINAETFAMGTGVLDATATGTLEDVRFQGEAGIAALLFNQTRLSGANLQASGRRTRSDGIIEASGHLTVDRLRLPEAPVRRLDVQAELEPGDEMAVTASADIDDLRKASLSAHLEGMWAASAVRIDSFQFQADQDQWSLERPTRVIFGNGLEIDSLAVSAEGQEIRASGRVATDGPLSLRIDLSNFDVTTVADLLGYPDLQGNVTARVELDGTAENPTMVARLQTRLDPSSPTPVDLQLQARYEEGWLGFDTRADLEGGRGGTVTGTVPVSFSLAGPAQGLRSGDSIRIEASADSLPIDWVSPLLRSAPVADLGGALDGSIRIGGEPDRPIFDGGLRLEGGSAVVRPLGVRYREGMASLRFTGDGVRVDSLRIREEDGSLSGSGSLRLSPLDQPEFDVTLRAHQFQAMKTSTAEVMVSGELHLTGSPREPTVGGKIEVDEANLYLGDITRAPDVQSVTLTEEDYRELAQVFGYRPPNQSAPASDLFQSTSLDLTVELRRDSWIRQRSNPQMAVQFTGQMSVTKDSGGTLELVGSIEGVPARSYIEQFGRRFSLASGTLNFQGPPSATQVDVRAEYEVPSRDNPDAPQVVIDLSVSGTVDDLSLQLSSTPQLAASDMVSYLITGRPADQSLESGGGSLSQTGGELALNRLSGAVEAYARQQVGLDVVEITTDGLDGVTLVAGRYVSPSLYLGIRQPVSLQRTGGETSQDTPRPEIEVELEAVRWLLLNLQAGGRGGVQFYVRSRIAYD